MTTCKDCLHYELCQYNTYKEAHYFGKDKQIYITIKNNSACKFFKPTSADDLRKDKIDLTDARERLTELLDQWQDICSNKDLAYYLVKNGVVIERR